MRILIADDEVSRVLTSQMLAKLTRHGSVDIVQNGREVIVAYLNSGSNGAFYDLVILDQNLSVLDGFTTVEMIRTFESDNRRSGKRTMVCVISSDDRLLQRFEVHFGRDERTHLALKPVDIDLLVSLTGSVAAEREINCNAMFQ